MSALAHCQNLSLRYGKTTALDQVTLDIPAGCMVGLIGPDGVGKSSLLALVAGARAMQSGQLQVLGGDMARAAHRRRVCPRIAYMPQGLGRNLYPSLSVEENLQFFARLFGQEPETRRSRIDVLTRSTGLHPFLARPAGQLSGGMKQKLALCCALIHEPAVLILDEPTTGLDPLFRAQFWQMIAELRAQRPGMSVLVATAYMDEAQGFDWLVALDEGRVLAAGTPQALLAHTGSASLEAAFIALLPEAKRRTHVAISIPPLAGDHEIAIEATGLTKRFGDFVAVDDVSFSIRRGEIFGFLGSNGCGKSTTMKMLTGLLPASAGQASLFGEPVSSHDVVARRRVGYMSQSFSLYGELTVAQNLHLHARLFHVPDAERPARVEAMAARFGLQAVAARLPEQLPLGMRQRLSLAVAMVHQPELLILDEPTSGLDPIARDALWRLMIEISRRDQVTIFISTHVMQEALRCDRISFMHAGRVLESDTPPALMKKYRAHTLEAAFIACLRQVVGPASVSSPQPLPPQPAQPAWRSSVRRIYSYLWRETLELKRDPVRGTLALVGSLMLMVVMGFGLSMDVDNLRYAVLDRDHTQLSRDYALNLAGSRYFVERAPLTDYAELDRRMTSGELSLAIEIPAGFARDVAGGRAAQIGAWVDGAMPQRAETVLGYVEGLHQGWLAQQPGRATPRAVIETRFRYNPDVKSLPAMMPAVIPLLLLMLPAMLTALAVVREKELGSIINFYVTPTTRLEFLLGKQLPYVALALVNFLLMCLAAVTAFGVPMKGDFFTLLAAAVLFSFSSTGMGLLASTLTKSQIAAMFFTMVGTMIPAVQFAGLINPVSSLEGFGRWVGAAYPASYMLIISRGVFAKALGFSDLAQYFWPMAIAAPVILLAALSLLKKQAR